MPGPGKGMKRGEVPMRDRARVLVVDDDPVTRGLLAGYLENEGYEVREADSAEAARELLRAGDVAVVLLDIRLPGEDGLQLTRELRARSDIGIILVTGSRKEAVDRVVGLELGADDYITKPFEPRELLARVRNLLRRLPRRGSATAPEPTGYRFSGWRLDAARRRLLSPDGVEQSLTEGEFRLLSMLLQNPGRVLSRDRLAENLRGREWLPNDRSVDVLVGRLRRKLGEDAARPVFIVTVRGAGYRFAGAVERE